MSSKTHVPVALFFRMICQSFSAVLYKPTLFA